MMREAQAKEILLSSDRDNVKKAEGYLVAMDKARMLESVLIKATAVIKSSYAAHRMLDALADEMQATLDAWRKER